MLVKKWVFNMFFIECNIINQLIVFCLGSLNKIAKIKHYKFWDFKFIKENKLKMIYVV